MNDDEDDMSNTVSPKSDQLQADDLVGGRTITIKINRRENKKGTEQPLSLFYDGDNGKPYKPSKGMRHVLIGLFGKSSKKYVGETLVLYRDEKVTFGPDTTGGVRISNASRITEPMTIIIPVKRGIRKPFTVKPLIMGERKTDNLDAVVAQAGRAEGSGLINPVLQAAGSNPANLAPAIDHTLEIVKRNARDMAINGTAALETWFKGLPKETQAKLKPHLEEYKKIASENEPKMEDKFNVTEG